MDIVDAQIHLVTNADAAIAMLDALGIQAAVIDDYWGVNSKGEILSAQTGFTHALPGYTLSSGRFRPTSPAAELASMRYPDRFAYILRIDYLDPDAEVLLKMAKKSPHVRGIRICALNDEEIGALMGGQYRDLLTTASDEEIPVFCYAKGPPKLWSEIFVEFKNVQFILDHCGTPARPDDFDDVLRLSAHPNVALKWSHAQRFFSKSQYPFLDVIPFLRRAIKDFGCERIMWASDYSQEPNGTWAECLFYLRDCPDLSPIEKEWLLGRTARARLSWAAPEAKTPGWSTGTTRAVSS